MFEICGGGANEGFVTVGSSGVTRMGETTMKNKMAMMEKIVNTLLSIR